MKSGIRRRILETRGRRIRTRRIARGQWERSTTELTPQAHIRCEELVGTEERVGERIMRPLPGRFPGACPYCARGRRLREED